MRGSRARPERVYLIECKPKILIPSLELSVEVEAAIDDAASMVMEIVRRLLSES